MEARSSSNALSLILCDVMRLLCPEMPPLGAQGTPSTQGATRGGHRLPSSGDRLAGGPHPRSSSERRKGKKPKPLFLPKSRLVLHGGDFRAGEQVTGQLRAPAPNKPHSSLAPLRAHFWQAGREIWP